MLERSNTLGISYIQYLYLSRFCIKQGKIADIRCIHRYKHLHLWQNLYFHFYHLFTTSVLLLLLLLLLFYGANTALGILRGEMILSRTLCFCFPTWQARLFRTEFIMDIWSPTPEQPEEMI
jgi:hypothetical protein